MFRAVEIGSVVALGALILLGPLGGSLIGKSKGRGVAGFFLGLFAGVLGWVIVGALPRKPAKEAEYQAKVEAARTGMPGSPSRRYSCWGADPFGRHGLRFFDDRWTDRVRDSGLETTDPPTFRPPDGLVDGSRWAPDPFGRFDERFFHDGRWTGHVSTGGVLSEDPPRFPAPMKYETGR